MSPPVILAGDIGGTHTRLALVGIRDGRLALACEATVPSRAHATLEEIVEAFVGHAGQVVTHAGFGIAGPVRDGIVDATNLPWHVQTASLAARLSLPEVTVVNDLEATAYGLAALTPADLVTLQAGKPEPRGNAAVIAAGTGLGEAGLVWDGRQRRPFASEGGHADFAPTDETQVELYRHLAREHGHVSVERVLSGPGLYTIYQFLRDTGSGPEPEWLTEALRRGEPPAVISEAALSGRSAVCARALDVFVRAYGAEAGNLGLRTMATAGVYVGGGIAPKILSKLQAPAFLDAFRAKGRLRSVLDAMPVHVIVSDQVGLLGAARSAALQAGLLA
jgi:glucokinase